MSQFAAEMGNEFDLRALSPTSEAKSIYFDLKYKKH